MHLLHDVLERPEMMEARARENQIVGVLGQLDLVGVAGSEVARDLAVDPALRLGDAPIGDVDPFDVAGRPLLEDAEVRYAGTAAEIEAEAGRSAEGPRDPRLPAQPVDERPFVKVRGDGGMIQPGVPFAGRLDVQMRAPIGVLRGQLLRVVRIVSRRTGGVRIWRRHPVSVASKR
jgi:hypothetical protein